MAYDTGRMFTMFEHDLKPFGKIEKRSLFSRTLAVSPGIKGNKGESCRDQGIGNEPELQCPPGPAVYTNDLGSRTHAISRDLLALYPYGKLFQVRIGQVLPFTGGKAKTQGCQKKRYGPLAGPPREHALHEGKTQANQTYGKGIFLFHDNYRSALSPYNDPQFALQIATFAALQYKGIFYILVSSLAYAVVNFCVKYLHNIPTHEIVFFRSVISLAICIFWVRQLGLPLLGRNRKWLLIRGAAGTTALFLFFLTLKYMPLASATTIQYMSPVFTIILATQMMGEKVRPVQWILFAIAFAGVLMIKGMDERVSYPYLAIGIISAMISGIAYNAIMKCRKTDHPVTVVLYFPLLATPIMGTACLYVEWVTPQGTEWLLLLLMGVFTQLAQLYMTKALHVDHSSRVMPFNYFGVIYALGIGFFVFGETLPWLSFAGIALVIGSVVANTLIKNPNEQLRPTQGVV